MWLHHSHRERSTRPELRSAKAYETKEFFRIHLSYPQRKGEEVGEKVGEIEIFHARGTRIKTPLCIHKVEIMPEFRRKGYATAAMTQLLALYRAQRYQFDWFLLAVEPGSHARALYAKLGFQAGVPEGEPEDPVLSEETLKTKAMHLMR